MKPSSSPFERVVLIVLDSVGCGGAPDAAAYGDEGSDTLGNTRDVVGLDLPNLVRLGLGRAVRPAPARDAAAIPVVGASGRMREVSAGKDTTTGHWEIAGVVRTRPFPTYPHGFPREVTDPFERAIGRKVLWNQVASGTEIIQRCGAEHVRTGRPILYTSADSVFQVAAHEEVVPLATLYDWCRTAREILRGPHEVGRVIARPFAGSGGAYVRTTNRRDFSVAPPPEVLTKVLRDRGLEVTGVGKIGDIFAGVGIGRDLHTTSNDEGVDAVIRLLHDHPRGLIFVNLVDFDTLYGHRNDAPGYRDALQAFDRRVLEILAALGPRDLLIITADHGNDPTTPSTDHSREMVPVLAFGAGVRPADLGVRETFADLGQTVAEIFGARLASGRSFLREIRP